jgi:MFS family permease
MENPRHLFVLMNNAFLGFILTALYGVLTSASLWFLVPATEFSRYNEAFFITFNCAISGGLVATTAILVLKTQAYVPQIVERAFTERELEKTDYYAQRRRFFSLVRSLTFSSTFAIAAFAIFYVARFPFTGLPEYFMIAFGCAQYAMGVYIGRKLFYVAQMLRSIDGLKISKNLFHGDKLSGLSTYVNAVSTLTAILVFVGVRSYYYAPFSYDSVLGNSARALMLIPAIIAIPVLALFNYYPRSVIRRLYEQSIDHSLRQLRLKFRNDSLTEFEKLSYIVEYDKISRDELKYRLRMNLTDLPMAVTLILAVLSVIATS